MNKDAIAFGKKHHKTDTNFGNCFLAVALLAMLVASYFTPQEAGRRLLLWLGLAVFYNSGMFWYNYRIYMRSVLPHREHQKESVKP